ncbi:hypothetical protein [Granulicoccus sp. GXG6511]|uniref:hypothetical protein n=1 Tax=Granulicoccus sp. GXG6511 TaxID=3381351 RepID=UPI003D7C688D
MTDPVEPVPSPVDPPVDPVPQSSPPDPDPTEQTPPGTPPGIWARIFGPPARALQELGGKFLRWLDRILLFWERLFTGAPDEGKRAATPAVKSAALLATALMALLVYGSVPLRDMLPWWLFIPGGIAVWLVLLASTGKLSRRGSGSRFERWLRESERRVGLARWEGVGLVLAILASLASLTQPTLLPLSLGAVIGFGVLRGQPIEERELIGVPPVPTLDPPEPPDPDADGDGDGAHPDFVFRTFSWQVRHVFGVDDHTVKVAVHLPTYERLKESNPGVDWVGGVPQIERYVVRGTTADVERLAVRLRDLSTDSRYSTYEQISSVLAMVQSITYSFDIDSTGHEEYWRYPVETMHDETGDCEDTTFLAGSLLRRLGHDVVVLFLPSHAALGVAVPDGIPGHFVEHEGQRYYYCETTGEGWRVGELPSGHEGEDVEIYPVRPFVAI